MTEPTLFDFPAPDNSDTCRQGNDYEADRTNCKRPDLATATAYSYGCRCTGCYKSQSARAYHLRQQKGPRLCATPGCDKQRRHTQGAKYCDDHATSRNYEPRQHRIICVICDRSVLVFKTKRYPICRACQEDCRGLFGSSVKHGVPSDLFIQWLRHPYCDLCNCRLYIGKGKSGAQGFTIDHDHTHCDGDTGCAVCVRGLLCHRCNCMVGGYEGMLRLCGVVKLAEYLHKSW